MPNGERTEAVIAAVLYQQFKTRTPTQWQEMLAPESIVIDQKGFVPREFNPIRLRL